MEHQKLIFASKSENIVLVEKLVDDVCDLFNVSEDHYGNILIAITEAVNNAIQHGNKANPEKKIEVAFKSKDNVLSFIIQDQGEGFAYDTLPDPTSPENLENPSGRGVFLMRNLADKVEFSEKGTRVTLIFNISEN